jgi:hypothetical protein
MVEAVRFDPSAHRTEFPYKSSIPASEEQANTQIASQSSSNICPELISREK